MENKDNQIFSTRDLYLATTLVTLKFYMVGIDVQYEGNKNQSIGYFKFEDTPAIQEAKQQYIQGMLQIEPKAFVTNMHSLKAEIVNAQNSPVRSG